MLFKTEAFQDSYSPEGFFCDLEEDEKTAAQGVEGFSIVVDRSWAATLQKIATAVHDCRKTKGAINLYRSFHKPVIEACIFWLFSIQEKLLSIESIFVVPFFFYLSAGAQMTWHQA